MIPTHIKIFAIPKEDNRGIYTKVSVVKDDKNIVLKMTSRLGVLYKNPNITSS